jgi:hypothetical protein
MLSYAAAANSLRAQERDCEGLPGMMDAALPFYRHLLKRHHDAMLAADFDTAMELRADAHRLARKLNGYEPGILAHDDAPGYVLDRETRASDGTVPLWGQSGSFVIAYDGMQRNGIPQLPWCEHRVGARMHTGPIRNQRYRKSRPQVSEGQIAAHQRRISPYSR